MKSEVMSVELDEHRTGAYGWALYCPCGTNTVVAVASMTARREPALKMSAARERLEWINSHAACVAKEM